MLKEFLDEIVGSLEENYLFKLYLLSLTPQENPFR